MARPPPRLIPTLPSDWRRDGGNFDGAPILPAPPSDLTDREIVAELMRQATEEPLLLHRFGSPRDPGGGHRRRLFASTLRGTIVASGGKRAGKTRAIGVARAAAIAEGRCATMGGRTYLGILSCPLGCPQWGTGTCGEHCCPQHQYGSADFRKEGCVAPFARACPAHPPVYFPESKTRLILYGCDDVAKFWAVIYEAGLKLLLCRGPGGEELWHCEKDTNCVVHNEKKYVIKAMPYDRVGRFEAYTADEFEMDEFPEEVKFVDAALYRVKSTPGALVITATAAHLLEGKAPWIVHRLKERSHLPDERIHWQAIKTFDNAFLKREARATEAAHARALLARGAEQEYRICYLGEAELRNDACYFLRRTLNKQAAYIAPSVPRWIALPSDDPRDEAARPYLAKLRPPSGMPHHQFEAWSDPDPAERYCLGVDIAEGKDTGDYSTIVGFKAATSGDQFLQYRGHCDPPTLAAVIYGIWRSYEDFGRGGIVIERNGPGRDVIHRLIYEYNMPAWVIFHRLDASDTLPSGDPVPSAGFAMTAGSKTGSTIETPYGNIASPLSALEGMCATGVIKIHSALLHGEMSVFIRKKAQLEAISGCHDDLVIAAALAAFGRKIVTRYEVKRPAHAEAPSAGRLTPQGPPILLPDAIDTRRFPQLRGGAESYDKPWTW